MEEQITQVREKLFTANYGAACAGNFMLFFAFYLLLPVLPMYLMETFGAENGIIGIVLSLYTITALVFRPFAGYMVDTFPRKMLLMVFYFVFISIFLGYLVAGTLMLFAIVRAVHGLAFGMVTVSQSTVAIDIMPSQRRGEGIGYFGVTTNLAMAFGPMAALYILELHHNYDYLFLISFVVGLAGFVCVCLIKAPQKAPQKEPQVISPVSLDRFFLFKGTWGAINLALISFSYGLLATYVAVYAKNEVGITSGTGTFFILMAVGLMASRILGAKIINKGQFGRIISMGIITLIVGFLLFVFFKNAMGYYISAVILGAGYGMICPSFLNLFINLAPNNKRGTASSTYFISWDLGLGLGVLFGGSIAQASDYTTAYILGMILIAGAFILFRRLTIRHFDQNKLR